MKVAGVAWCCSQIPCLSPILGPHSSENLDPKAEVQQCRLYNSSCTSLVYIDGATGDGDGNGFFSALDENIDGNGNHCV